MTRRDGAQRLDGWKAIAAFFGRDERTVKRWEASRGLPVHRIPGGGRAAVWADAGELRFWLAGGSAAERDEADGPPQDPPQSRPPSRRRLVAAGAGGLVAAGAAFVLLRLWPHPPAAASRDVAAYDDDPATRALYLQALVAWHSRTPEGLTTAVADLNEVIRRRPGRAEGYAKLADCYLLLREFGAMPQAEAYRRAEAAARKAIELNPGDAGAVRALAFIQFWWKADPEALRLFARALELDPQSVQTRQWYANALGARGRFRDALDQLHQAQALAPSDVVIASTEAETRAGAGDVAGALRDLRQMARAYPTSIAVRQSLARCLLLAGDAAGYLAQEEAEAKLRGDAARTAALASVRAAYARGGAKAMYEAFAETESAARATGRGSAVMTADYWALAGDTAQARRWLATARAIREPDLIYLPALPVLAALDRR